MNSSPPYHFLHHLVLIVGGFFLLLGLFIIVPKSHAQSLDLTVTAKVDAPLPTSPAIITSPMEQEHFTNPAIIVSGTCGDGAYVVIERNSTQAGMTMCNSGSFSLPLSLTPGSNQLQARVYNTTDNEGPVGPAITVYYDIIIPPPTFPVETLFQLQVSSVDGIPFAPGVTYRTSTRPTLQGYAQPGSIVTASYSPGDSLCKTTANARGQWVCIMASELDVGHHQVAISSISPQGVISQFPVFSIIVAPTVAPMATAPTPPLTLAYLPLIYNKIKVGEPWSNHVTILGGAPPYTLTVNWGDTTSSTYENLGSEPVGFTHSFQKSGTFSPILYATDSLAQRTFLQTMVVVASDTDETTKSSGDLPSSVYIPIVSGIGVVVAASIIIETAAAIGAIKSGWSKGKK